MRHPKDGIFDFQCWRDFQHIVSDSSRCLCSSASFLNSSFMPSILQLSWLWNWEWKNIENPWSRVENFCNLYLLEPEACGLFAAQSCFTQGFPSLLLTTEQTKAARPNKLYTSLYLCIYTWYEMFAYHTGSVFCFPVVYLSCREIRGA